MSSPASFELWHDTRDFVLWLMRLLSCMKVFIVNYMTTKYYGDHRLLSAPFDTKNGLEIPALGEVYWSNVATISLLNAGDSWSHAIAARLYLTEDVRRSFIVIITMSLTFPSLLHGRFISSNPTQLHHQTRFITRVSPHLADRILE